MYFGSIGSSAALSGVDSNTYALIEYFHINLFPRLEFSGAGRNPFNPVIPETNGSGGQPD